jgi:demethylmenaquinone methyltransferase/2-methoxy-6-polyprenyl-1,4-benzoquinol methylase
VTNKYLSYDEKRAPRVREMFSRLAERYDLVNDIMSLGMHRFWKRRTVRLALDSRARRPPHPGPPAARSARRGRRPRPALKLGEGGPLASPAKGEGEEPLRLLDLCCGTGDLCFYAEEAAASAVRATGADFTLPMLAVARRRKGEEGRSSAFVQADALSLPFPDGSFDAITVGYGLRNIADPQGALREMRRVLAPGGRLVVLDFGKPDNPIFNALYQGYMRVMMPAVGLLFHGDPETYLYIPESLKRYPGQRGVERMMQEAGFDNAWFEERLLGTMGFNIGEVTAKCRTS